MAETFAKNSKRDYARAYSRQNAATILQQLDGWFERYNGLYPHDVRDYNGRTSSSCA